MTEDQWICNIWICECCMLCHNNGECCAEDHECEPLGDINPSYFILSGLYPDDHKSNCPNRSKPLHQGDPHDCDCGTRDLSMDRCDGCGDRSHGKRFMVSYWKRG